jgi:hypothetical protein
MQRSHLTGSACQAMTSDVSPPCGLYLSDITAKKNDAVENAKTE